jgi:hypothetical protein
MSSQKTLEFIITKFTSSTLEVVLTSLKTEFTFLTKQATHSKELYATLPFIATKNILKVEEMTWKVSHILSYHS